MDNILVSILIPVYNTAEYLPVCLDSVLNQEYRNIEVLVVNDASTDNSAMILSKYAKNDQRVKIITHETNRGLLQARKTAVLQASGSYVLFVDSDDSIPAGIINAMVTEISSHPVDILQICIKMNAKQRLSLNDFWNFRHLRRPYRGYLKDREVFDYCFIRARYPWNIWGKLIRADLCRKAVSKIDEKYYFMLEDYYLYSMIAFYAKSYFGSKQQGYIYNYGSGVCGRSVLSLKEFEMACTAPKALDSVEKFLKDERVWDHYRPVFDFYRETEWCKCFKLWQKLEPQDRSAGFELLCDKWSAAVVFAHLAETFAWNHQLPAIVVAGELVNFLRCVFKRNAHRLKNILNRYDTKKMG